MEFEKVFKKSLICFSILSLSLSLTGCGDSSATIDQHNLEVISQSTAFDDDGIMAYQQELAQCKQDKNCQSKVTYTVYDKAFSAEGFSQIGTAINFMEWSKGAKERMVTMESQRLSINWGELFIGIFMCLNNESCTQWLLDSGKATEADIQSFKAIKSELS
jgi:hypothetical protein